MWNPLKKTCNVPPIRPFQAQIHFEVWMEKHKPEGDFCWVAVTEPNKRYRLVETWRGRSSTGEEITPWVHGSVGEYVLGEYVHETEETGKDAAEQAAA